MKEKLKRLTAILASGYILVYFSEHLFWAHIRPGDGWDDWIMVWLFYSLTGYIFLSAVALFRVRDFWGLFLAGAIFGWLTEGVIVQTVFEDLPLSISFTGLAWHALLSVGVGWYALRRAIHKGLWRTVWLSVLIGLAYGLWAITWWVEPEDMMVTAPGSFFSFSFVATVFAVLAYWLYDRMMPTDWKPAKWSVITAAVLLVLYFLFISIPTVPLAAIILPLLLASVVTPLTRNRRAEPPGSMLDNAPQALRLWHYFPLLLIPISAAGFYSLAYLLEWRVPTNWAFYLITTPAGFVLWGMSIIKLWRKKSTPAKENS